MMQVKELAVGDWVQNPLGYKAVILDIRRYDDGRDAFHYVVKIGEDSNNWQRLAVEELLPIPLTPEILEKNGFRKDDETDQWYFKSNDRLDMGILAVGIDDGCGVGLCVMRNGAITYYCKYVHELQHYLRLIGGAEEIIL